MLINLFKIIFVVIILISIIEVITELLSILWKVGKYDKDNYFDDEYNDFF